MYMDWVIVSSLIVVALTCAIVVYIGVYALKKIRKEIERTTAELEINGKNSQCRIQNRQA